MKSKLSEANAPFCHDGIRLASMMMLNSASVSDRLSKFVVTKLLDEIHHVTKGRSAITKSVKP